MWKGMELREKQNQGKDWSLFYEGSEHYHITHAPAQPRCGLETLYAYGLGSSSQTGLDMAE